MTDKEIETLLNKIEEKNREFYKVNKIKTNYSGNIYQRLNVLRKGKAIPVSEFKVRYAKRLDKKLEALEKVLDDNYIYELENNFKENLQVILYNLGKYDLAREIEQLSVEEVREKRLLGEYDDLLDLYEGDIYEATLSPLK